MLKKDSTLTAQSLSNIIVADDGYGSSVYIPSAAGRAWIFTGVAHGRRERQISLHSARMLCVCVYVFVLLFVYFFCLVCLIPCGFLKLFFLVRS